MTRKPKKRRLKNLRNKHPFDVGSVRFAHSFILSLIHFISFHSFHSITFYCNWVHSFDYFLFFCLFSIHSDLIDFHSFRFHCSYALLFDCIKFYQWVPAQYPLTIPFNGCVVNDSIVYAAIPFLPSFSPSVHSLSHFSHCCTFKLICDHGPHRA